MTKEERQEESTLAGEMPWRWGDMILDISAAYLASELPPDTPTIALESESTS